MAKEANMSARSMRRLVQDDLKMKPNCLKKRQFLSNATKEKRLKRSKLLLWKLKSGLVSIMVWSDEKIFSIQQAHNPQNDCARGATIWLKF